MSETQEGTVLNWVVDSSSLFYYSNPQIALFMSMGVAFLYYYLTSVAQRPKLYCKAGKLRNVLEAMVPAVNEKYYPTPWCFGTHSQTALSNFFRSLLPDIKYQRELLDTPDGGVLALDWFPSDLPQNAPIAFFMAGLTGHSQTEYIKSIIPGACRQGCRVAVLNNRGRGGVDLRTAKTYCAVSFDDMGFALRKIKERYPESIIVACGISLGGVILGHYLSESREEAMCDAAMLISSVYDVGKAVYSLELPGLNRLLNRHLARNLWLTVEPHKDKFEEFRKRVNLDDVQKSTTIKEFDERFTSKMFGFQSVDQYYDAATLSHKIRKTKIPTLCVCAADDMFQPADALPVSAVEDNANLAFIVTTRGGHIGFMDGLLPFLPFFSERLYEQFLASMVASVQKGVFKNK